MKTTEKSNFDDIFSAQQPKGVKQSPIENDIDRQSEWSSMLDVALKYAKIERIQKDTEARQNLGCWAKRVIVVYLIVVFLLIIFGYNTLFKIFNFNDTIMITLLGTTTANVVGLGYIVLKGYFGVDDIEVKDK